MIKMIAYTYADGEEEFLRHDEPSFDPRANEKCSLQGYFLTDSELEQLKREYFKAGRMLDYLDPDIIYPPLSYKTFEDYEASKKDSHE